MNDEEQKRKFAADAELEREIRKERKFSLVEAIGRLAGPGSMKGASPIARLQQAEVEIATWLRTHLQDAGGALEIVLHRHVRESAILLNNSDRPLVVLAACCRRALDSDYLLHELVRDTDVEWSRTMGERPYFQQEGAPPHPDDPYTVESVRRTLNDVLSQLELQHSQ